MDLHDRRVLLLGGLGFLGLNLVPHLVRAGARVSVVNRSRDPSAVRWLRDAGGGRAELVQGVVGRAQSPLGRWLEDADLVINLTGRSGASESLRSPLLDADANVLDQLALLEALRRCRRPPHLIFFSSRLVYGATGAGLAAEGGLPRPNTIYGAHKLAVEHYLGVYGKCHGLPYTVLRLTNPYGAYQPIGRTGFGAINRFMIAALRDETITIYGEGKQRRDYLHVDDVAAAVIRVATDRRAVAETFNIGAGISEPIGEVAERIVALAGGGRIERVGWPAAELTVETGDFFCDIGHARRQIGWSPRVPLEAGLRTTIHQYRSLMAEGGGEAHP